MDIAYVGTGISQLKSILFLFTPSSDNIHLLNVQEFKGTITGSVTGSGYIYPTGSVIGGGNEI